MTDTDYHGTIAAIVRRIVPLDEREREDVRAVLEWIDSGAPLCRVVAPDSPAKHLVSYFVVVDPERRRALLIDHIKAGLWLPSGGHVEPGEHPAVTARRELAEELGLMADFVIDDPIFITVTTTVGSTAGHTDVSLWYVVRGDSRVLPWFDASESHGIAWFDLGALPSKRTDPHLHRFAEKLADVLDGVR